MQDLLDQCLCRSGCALPGPEPVRLFSQREVCLYSSPPMRQPGQQSGTTEEQSVKQVPEARGHAERFQSPREGERVLTFLLTRITKL